MRRGPTREMISLGLIGVGPSWERRYRPAIRRLCQRIGVRVVHDPVLGRAQVAAQETGAEVVSGLRQVMDHPGLDGVLVLDTGWYGLSPLLLPCRKQHPVFLAGGWQNPPDDWRQLHEHAQEQGVMFVPELPLRFVPATTRLRELMASKLGSVRQLRLWLQPSFHESPEQARMALAAAVDWCAYVARQAVGGLSSPVPHPEGGQVVELRFRPDFRGQELVPAEIITGASSLAGQGDVDIPFRAAVICEQGEAVLEGAKEIAWSVGQAPAVLESLHQERCEVDVMLDQFCRRLVGGLIPTATLHDVAIALQQVSGIGV